MIPTKQTRLDTIRNFSSLKTKKRTETNPTTTQQRFINKQRAKAITVGVTAQLLKLNSELHEQYKRAHYCAEYLYQDGTKVTSNYCKSRSCNVCNRIRSAQMLKGYSIPLQDFKDLHFVTLTAPNVTGDELKDELDKFGKAWQRIYRNTKNRLKIELKGLRKLECTHSPKTNKYNPHYHIIIEGKEAADQIVRQWLKQFPDAKRKGQDIRKADGNALYELFKYVTKSVTGNTFNAAALNTMFLAMQNRNTYYPIGIKKYASEDIEDSLQSFTVNWHGEKVEVWKWYKEFNDWIAPDGEPFIDKKIDKKTVSLIDKINKYNPPKLSNKDELFKNHRANFRDRKESLF